MAASENKGVSPQVDIKVLKWVKIEQNPLQMAAEGRDIEPQYTAEEVSEQFGLPRNTFREFLEKEVAVSEACWSLPFTLLLVISYAMFAILHDSALFIRSAEDSIAHEITEVARWSYAAEYAAHKTVEDVNNVADFWSWVSRGLVPMAFNQEHVFHEIPVWWEDPYNRSHPMYEQISSAPVVRGNFLRNSVIVGGIRMQQERSGDDLVKAPCKTLPSLLDFYGMDCVHGHGYELDPEMRSARFTTNPVMQKWLYTYEDIVEIQSKVWDMERTEWFDRHTRKVEIALPVYNRDLEIHTLFYTNFFESRGGHIWKRTIPLSVVGNWHPSWYYWVADCTWVLCVLYIVITELIEVGKTVKQYGAFGVLSQYFGFWNILDWVSLACAAAVIILYILCMQMTADTNDKMEAIPSPPTGDQDEVAYQSAVKAYVDALEVTVQTGHLLKLWIFAYPFVIIARLFKAYSVQPRLAVMTSTISRAAKDLVHFLIVVASVFLTFVVAGCILFGREVRSFGTFPRAMFACFRMLLGDLMWDELREVGVTEAAIWLSLFIVLVVMVLLNMLLAIIMDHYQEQSKDAMDRLTLWGEARKEVRRFRAENAGRAVPVLRILDAMVAQDQRNAQELLEREDEDIEEEEEDDIGPLVKVTEIVQEYTQEWCTKQGDGVRCVTEQQVTQLMAEAIVEYETKHAKHSDMDEVVYLTRKVDYRTKKIMKMAKDHSKRVQNYNELADLKNMTKEFTIFAEELRGEREAQVKEAEELRNIKRGLLLQLQLRMPDADFSSVIADGGGAKRKAPTKRDGEQVQGDAIYKEHSDIMDETAPPPPPMDQDEDGMVEMVDGNMVRSKDKESRSNIEPGTQGTAELARVQAEGTAKAKKPLAQDEEDDIDAPLPPM